MQEGMQERVLGALEEAKKQLNERFEAEKKQASTLGGWIQAPVDMRVETDSPVFQKVYLTIGGVEIFAGVVAIGHFGNVEFHKLTQDQAFCLGAFVALYKKVAGESFLYDGFIAKASA